MDPRHWPDEQTASRHLSRLVGVLPGSRGVFLELRHRNLVKAWHTLLRNQVERTKAMNESRLLADMVNRRSVDTGDENSNRVGGARQDVLAAMDPASSAAIVITPGLQVTVKALVIDFGAVATDAREGVETRSVSITNRSGQRLFLTWDTSTLHKFDLSSAPNEVPIGSATYVQSLLLLLVGAEVCIGS
jgi:hypothetical protein